MKKIDLSKVLFYIFYTLIIFYYMCGKINGITPVRDLIFQIVPLGLLFLIAIQSKKYNIKSIIIIIASVFITFISYLITDSNEIFLTLLFIIASKNVEMDKIVKYDLIVKLILTLVLFSFSGLGFTNDEIKYRDGVTRYSWGFGHPNALGAFLFSMCVDLIYLHYKKLKIRDWLFIIISLLICTFVCNSRGAQIGIIVLVVFYIIFPKLKSIKIFRKIVPLLPTICFIMSFILVILYLNNNEAVFKLNEFTSNRIKFAAEFYDYYGISLLGNHLKYLGLYDLGAYLTMLDVSYLNILIQYGLIITGFICYGSYKMLNKALNDNKDVIVLGMIAVCIYGLMEVYIFMIAYNVLLLYVGNLIYLKTEGVGKDEKSSNNNVSLIA